MENEEFKQGGENKIFHLNTKIVSFPCYWKLYCLDFIATLLKKRLQHRCFPVNIAKFLRTPFFTEHLRSLPLLIPPNILKIAKLYSFIYSTKNFYSIGKNHLCSAVTLPSSTLSQKIW